MTGRLRPTRRRRRLLALPLVAALLAVGLKSLTMYWFAAAGTSAYADGHWERAETNFRRLGVLDIVDPSLDDLGLGDALYRQGDLLGAEDAFRRALAAAPDDCEIRFNLAVTLEAQGDLLAAGDSLADDTDADPFDRRTAVGPGPDDPRAAYQDAMNIVDGRTCRSIVPDDAGARLAETRERLSKKLGRDRDPQSDTELAQEENESIDNEGVDTEQVNELDARNRAGAAQREATRDLDTSGRSPGQDPNW
ncbi:tetratricopeptide repeat protein [Desertimonas flava]|uniref:tetratricopeptide repeat protein n=1 Tax=Desertimonas flava TaxID=2064846 RepID=UPI0013C463F8|nr:tetratricopeptide repeat protein [Desertimonas flava]